MPSESDFVERMRVSRSTVIRALKAIEDQGLIERRQGSGSFVTRKAVQEPAARTAIGLLRAVQSGRHPDSVADQIQSRLNALLQQRGSALIVHTVEENDDPLVVANKLMEQRIGGMFMVPLILRGEGVATAVVAEKVGITMPIVLLDGDAAVPPHRSSFDVVGVENRYCGYLQTRHLLELGLRRILFVGADPRVSTITERHLGYLEAMAGHGIDPPADWTCTVTTHDLDAASVESLIARHRPDGIVCRSDEVAALLMNHVHRLGIRVPDQLKIVGFDDRPIASLLPITLTTIRQPIAAIAEAAVQFMDARIAQPRRPASRVQIAGELIVRQSSAG